MADAPTPKRCAWQEDDEGNWETSCGEMHIFTTGGPVANKHRYCAYCGELLEEQAYQEPEVRDAD